MTDYSIPNRKARGGVWVFRTVCFEWAIDFQFDSEWKGRVFKVCNVIDEFTRQHLVFRVERRMGAADVIEMLDLAVLAHGAPQVLRADNGPEFIAAALGRWANEHDTLQAFIPPGQPWHNGFVESLHNRMRDELLEDNSSRISTTRAP